MFVSVVNVNSLNNFYTVWRPINCRWFLLHTHFSPPWRLFIKELGSFVVWSPLWSTWWILPITHSWSNATCAVIHHTPCKWLDLEGWSHHIGGWRHSYFFPFSPTKSSQSSLLLSNLKYLVSFKFAYFLASH